MAPLIHIAIADDHSLMRKGLSDLIDSFGPFKVIIEAADGIELLELLQATEVQPDICILDVNMPRLDGFSTLTEIRKNWPQIRVLALTMYNNDYTIIRMIRNGANGYLLKNCNPIVFRDALLEIFHNGYYDPAPATAAAGAKAANEPSASLTITPKELEFLLLCCSELAYKEIANKMGVSPRTVEDHRDNLFRKLKVNTRSGLVMYAMRAGIVPP